MGLFGKLFGKKGPNGQDHAASPPVQGSGSRTISYDPSLVASLKHDHDELVAQYQRLGELHRSGRFGEIRGELINFKTRFEAHVLTENVRFYTYLEQTLMGDAHNAELMRDFRREMNTIARGAVNFVKKYQISEFDSTDREQFTKDYQTVGSLLTQRIEREESGLYPLYQQD